MQTLKYVTFVQTCTRRDRCLHFVIYANAAKTESQNVLSALTSAQIECDFTTGTFLNKFVLQQVPCTCQRYFAKACSLANAGKLVL